MNQNRHSVKNHWLSLMHFGRCFGCHQRPDRSFFYKNKQFPVCARCTGVIIGQFISIILFLAKLRLSTTLSVVFCTIMFADWFIQKINVLPSTNIRRLITGSLGGYGYMTIVCKIAHFIICIL